ncbi:MAG: hypothetical protein IKR26_01370 [Lachnospiraceae bacterium]|nr:hypothetical protein [Lachnospiraceae bacterium]
MMKIFRRVLSFAISLSLIIGTLTVTALADDGPTPLGTIAEAIDALGDSTRTSLGTKTFKLTANISAGSGQILYVVAGENITLDLAGHRLRSTTFKKFITVQGGGVFTLIDSEGGGTLEAYINATSTSTSYTRAVDLKDTGSTFNLESGTIKSYVVNGAYDGFTAKSTLRGNLIYAANGTSFNMTGGMVTEWAPLNVSYTDGGMIFLGNGTHTINGGTVSNGISNSGGNIMLNGGNLTISGNAVITGGTAQFGGNIRNYGGTLTINGGTISNGVSSTMYGEYPSGANLYASNAATTIINGGTFSGTTSTNNNFNVYLKGSVLNQINGGTFESPVRSGAATIINGGTFKSSISKDNTGAYTVNGGWFANSVSSYSALTLGTGKYATGSCIDAPDDDATYTVDSSSTYTITYKLPNGNDIDTDSESHGTQLTVKDDYSPVGGIFYGWYYDDDFTKAAPAAGDSVEFHTSLPLYAKVIPTYNVTVNVDGTQDNTISGVYESGKSWTVPSYPVNGNYAYIGYSIDENNRTAEDVVYHPGDTVLVSADATVNLYTVRVASAAKIGNVGYATFDAAYAAAVTGDTIVLNANTSTAGGFDESSNGLNGRTYTIDLNGYTLSYTGSTFLLRSRSTLTITDKSVGGGGTIDASLGTISQFGLLYNNLGAALTLTGGVTVTGDAGAVSARSILLCSGFTAGRFVINNATVTNTNSSSGYAIRVDGYNNTSSGTSSITGGTINGNIYMNGVGGTLNISGASTVVNGNMNVKSTNFNISAGDFKGTISVGNSTTSNITGGYYATPPAGLFDADVYGWYSDSSHTGCTGRIGTIGAYILNTDTSTSYTSFALAVAGLTDDDQTLQLQTGFNTNIDIAIADADYRFIIDLNGQTINGLDAGTPTVSVTNSTVTIINGTISGNGKTSLRGAVYAQTGADITLGTWLTVSGTSTGVQGLVGAYSDSGTASITVDGASIIGHDANDYGIRITTNGVLNFVSGNLTYDLSLFSGRTTISGGFFDGTLSKETAAACSITGGWFASEPDSALYDTASYEWRADALTHSGYAGTIEEKAAVTYVVKISDTDVSYASLDAAIAALGENGQTILLLSAFDLTQDINIAAAPYSFTLNLGGYVLTGDSSSANPAVTVSNSTVTITNGTINVTKGAVRRAAIDAGRNGTVTLGAGLTVSGSSTESYGIIGGYSSDSSSVLNISGATISGTDSAGKGLYIVNGTTMNITSGTISTAIYLGTSTVSISGGTFGGGITSSNAATLTVSGGTFNSSFAPHASATVTVTGGDFSALGTLKDIVSLRDYNIIINSGRYVVSSNSTGNAILRDGSNNEYSSFAAAASAVAETGSVGTVTLLYDIITGEYMNLGTTSVTVTFDLASKTIDWAESRRILYSTANANVTYQNGSITAVKTSAYTYAGGLFYIQNGSLAFRNIDIDVSDTSYLTSGNGGLIYSSGSTLVLDDCALTCPGLAQTSITAGYGGAVYFAGSGSTMTVTDSSIGGFRANQGGAVQVGGGATLNADNLTVTNCFAVSYGGAFFAYGIISLEDSSVSGCTATEGQQGTTAYMSTNSSLTVSGTTVITGDASENARNAIYFYAQDSASVTFNMTGGYINATVGFRNTTVFVPNVTMGYFSVNPTSFLGSGSAVETLETPENGCTYHVIHLEVDAASITLANQLAINYYCSIPLDSYSGQSVYMVGSCADEEFRVNGILSAQDESAKHFVFTFDGIDPRWMSEDIETQYYLGDTMMNEKTYSVVEYCGDIYAAIMSASESGGVFTEYDGKLLTMLSDMLIYGKTAQLYKGFDTSRLCTAATVSYEGELRTVSYGESDLEWITSHASKGTAAETFTNRTVLYGKNSNLTGLVNPVSALDFDLVGATCMFGTGGYVVPRFLIDLDDAAFGVDDLPDYENESEDIYLESDIFNIDSATNTFKYVRLKVTRAGSTGSVETTKYYGISVKARNNGHYYVDLGLSGDTGFQFYPYQFDERIIITLQLKTAAGKWRSVQVAEYSVNSYCLDKLSSTNELMADFAEAVLWYGKSSADLYNAMHS